MIKHKKHRMNRKLVFIVIIFIFTFIDCYAQENGFVDSAYRDRNKNLAPSSDKKMLAGITNGSFIGTQKNDSVNLWDFHPTSEEKHTNSRVKRPLNPTLKRTMTQSYIEREPISISSDFQLNNSGFKGNGTLDDPIRIENFNITDPTDTLVGLIDIRSTTYYFLIVNCLINGLGTTGNGIYFDDVSHGTIVNNTIYDNGWNGILVTASESITIESNTIYDSGGPGITIDPGSDNSSIIRNHVYSNGGSGIVVEKADSNKIFNNSIYENVWNGIHLRNSSYNFISNNSIHDHAYTGILLFSSSYNILSHNTMYNHGTRGIGVGEADSNNNTLFSNTIYNSGGSGILVATFQVNLNIYNTIINNTCFNNSLNVGSDSPGYHTSGISIDNSSANISNNTVFDNFDNGMLVFASKNTVVSNNIIRNNGRHGISVALAKNTTVANNEVFTNTNDGIHLFGSLNNSILNNSIYNNLITGISLSPFDDLGISWNSDNNIIMRNEIYNNNLHGIELSLSENSSVLNNTANSNLWGAENNMIAQNLIFDNGKDGIIADKLSKDNFVQFNDFSRNNVGDSQVVDNGSNNVFDYNYWSDWIGTGSYPINGTTKNQDSSPLSNPYHLSAPAFTSPAHDTLILTDSVIIQWTPSTDTFGHSYTYSLLYSTDDRGSWTTLASGLTSTNYSLDTTTITNGTSITLKVHVVDSVGFFSRSASTKPLTFQNEVEEPDIFLTQMIFALLFAICSITGGYYLVNTKFRDPSFIEYFQSDKIEFLTPIYHKVIIGLESIQTAILSEAVGTPLLEEPAMPTSLVTWFPDHYRRELKTKLKGRTILTLIEIAFQYSEDANLTKLAQALEIPVSTLSDELKKLVNLNYLDFHVTPHVLHDGRYRHYIITSKGISFLKILKSALELSIRRAKEKDQFV
ncbi:MAG: right-handed parallel beta-helix repeat-containing protein [Candidatus Hodarchaeales archaeon]